MRILGSLQSLGRALMLPIAVLPIAGLLLRLGQPDLLDLPYVAAAGSAIFSNLGLLFAAGIAVGLARENHGAAALAAVVAYLVTTEGAKVLITVPAEVSADLDPRWAELAVAAFKDGAVGRLSVPAGLICGLLAGWIYNRTANIRLPDYLAFFSGRRFVPIASGFAALVLAGLFGLGWPLLTAAMDTLSQTVLDAGELGLFLYGALNRLLIVTGLHHILNNLAWFILGDFNGVTGDLTRFFEGDPTAGVFMSGFFPVMMFGLPAACLAMYHTVPLARRKSVQGLLLSMGLTSFLTGITEPIEFAFMFLSPVLYLLHALLTGLSMVIMDWLGVRLGFGFSAGLFDYVLNFPLATRPLWMIPMGLAYFAIYYTVFRYCIVRFGLKTPGRDDVQDSAHDSASACDPSAGDTDEAGALIAALGGGANLTSIDACTTRLRLKVNDDALIDETRLRALGAAGVIKPGSGSVQVVMGLRADTIASNLRRHPDVTGAVPLTASVKGPAPESDADLKPFAEPAALFSALGGRGNVGDFEALGTRLGLHIGDRSLVDEAALQLLGFRGLAWLSSHRAHLVASQSVAPVISALSDDG